MAPAVVLLCATAGLSGAARLAHTGPDATAAPAQVAGNYVGQDICLTCHPGQGGTYEPTGPVPDRTLPEEVPPTTLPTPEALPPTFSRLHRAVTDLTYWTNERLGIGLSYWFEDYAVEDFTLDVEATPNLLRGNTLLLGYLYRPYTANTVWARVIYRF